MKATCEARKMRQFLKIATFAGLTSLALAPAPALADTSRTERVIVGAVALAIIGSALHQNQQRPREVTPLIPNSQRVEVRPYDPGALPAHCLQRYSTYQGELQLFNGACLEHSYPAYRHLPLGCAVTVREGNRYSSGFRPRCLRDAGYRLAGS